MKLQKNFNFIFNPLSSQITKRRWSEDYCYSPSSNDQGFLTEIPAKTFVGNLNKT